MKTATMSAPQSERRSQGPTNRFRRLIVFCVTETDIDTIAAVVMSFQAILLVALVAFQTKIIELPPPYFENFVLRLPLLYWDFLLMIGLLWYGFAWKSGNGLNRRNAAIFGSALFCVLAGSIFLKGPGLAVAILLMNTWQIIFCGRLWEGCKKSC